MPIVTETRRKYEIEGMTAEGLIERIKAYRFKDEHGHRIDNCVEFIELATRAVEREAMKLDAIGIMPNQDNTPTPGKATD